MQTMWLEAETAKHMGKLGKIFEVDTDPGLDTIKKAACRKAFDEADENGNGLLDREEIGLLCPSDPETPRPMARRLRTTHHKCPGSVTSRVFRMIRREA